MLKVWNTWSDIYMGNTIEYDTKSYQVRMTIVQCTSVQIKKLRLNVQRTKCWHGQQVCDAMKQT